MARRVFFATIAMGFVASAAWAEGRAINSGEEAQPHATAMVGTREICTTRKLVAGIRTECRTEAVPEDQPNPLKGICITAYGNRSCY